MLATRIIWIQEEEVIREEDQVVREAAQKTEEVRESERKIKKRKLKSQTSLLIPNSSLTSKVSQIPVRRALLHLSLTRIQFGPK